MTTTRGLVRRTTRKNRTHVDYQLLHSGKSGKEVDVDLAGDEDMNMKVNVNIDRIKGGKISKKRSSLPQRVDTSVTNSTASHSDGNSSSEDEFAAVVCHECGCNSEICILEKEPQILQDIILCDGKSCNRAYHFRCNEIPLFTAPSSNKQWLCFSCQCQSKNKARQEEDTHHLRPSCRNLPVKNAHIKKKTELVLSELRSLRQKVTRNWMNICKMEDVIRTFETTMKNMPMKRAFEFVELKHAKTKRGKFQKRILEMIRSLHTYILSNPFQEPRFDDECSEISASDMRCSFCRHNSSSDDNDIFMCDHAGCGRMMHQNCFAGDLDPNEEKDWFCPFCDTLSDMLVYIERGHNEYHHDHISIDNIDDIESLFASTKSSSDLESQSDSEDSDFSKCSDNKGDDENDDSSDSENEDMKDELWHLKKDMTCDESEIFESSDQRARVLKEKASKVKDLGAFSEANIVTGKRKRESIDYQVLNSALFGTQTNADLDDEEDF